MKNHLSIKNILPWVGGLLILAACQKEQTAISSQDEETPQQKSMMRVLGAAPDNPFLVAKVPLVVSSEFKATNPTESRGGQVLPSTPKPASYAMQMPPVGDQGVEGSCISWAAGYAALSAEQYYKTNAGSYSSASNVFSPEFLFNQTKNSDDCGSSTLLTALEFMKNNGVSTWQSMPYSSSNGCSEQPTAEQASEAMNYRISSYTRIKSADQNAIKAMLAQNHPLIFTGNVDDNFRNAGPGFVWATVGTIYGLHAFTLVGYDDAKGAYKIMNSWGTGWGDGGYSWVSYSTMAKVTNHLYLLDM
jgi:hypothetical protein